MIVFATELNESEELIFHMKKYRKYRIKIFHVKAVKKRHRHKRHISDSDLKPDLSGNKLIDARHVCHDSKKIYFSGIIVIRPLLIGQQASLFPSDLPQLIDKFPFWLTGFGYRPI